MRMMVLMAVLAFATGDNPGRPDLAVVELSEPPALARPGDRLSVRDVTVNEGRGRAAASQTRYSLGRWIRLGTRSVPPLHKSARSEGALELTVPRTAPDGTYAL